MGSNPTSPVIYIFFTVFMKYKIAFSYHWQDCKIKLYFLLFSFFITFAISFIFKIEVFYLLGKVFIQFSKNIIFTKVAAGFWVYFKLSLWSALFFLMPLFLYFTFLFILKGFKTYQSNFFFLLLSLFYSFYISILLSSLYYIFPFFFSFFLSFENPTGLIPLHLEARFDQYIIFISNYFLLIMWVILLPLILLLVNYLLWKKLTNLRKSIYFFFLLSFAVLAPPDLALQLFFLVLLILITEILIFLFFLLKVNLENSTVESRIRTCDEN